MDVIANKVMTIIIIPLILGFILGIIITLVFLIMIGLHLNNKNKK